MTKIVIVAAGVGSRMKELTKDIPKCMVDIRGKPLIQHQIEEFLEQGFRDIIFCLGYRAQQVIDHFGDGSRFGARIDYSVENYTDPESLLGTAGAIKLLEGKIQEDFIAYYGDNLTRLDLNKLLDFHRNKNAFSTIVVRPKRNERFSSVIVKDKDDRITRFLEKPDEAVKAVYAEQETYENNGIYVLSKGIFSNIEAGKKVDFAYHIFPSLISRKKIYAYVSTSFFREIGNPEKYKRYIEEKQSL